MAVGGTGIGSGANQEIHHVVVATADRVVEAGDAFVVGLARVVHLWNTAIVQTVFKNSL